jgi:hypothetical protein
MCSIHAVHEMTWPSARMFHLENRRMDSGEIWYRDYINGGLPETRTS